MASGRRRKTRGDRRERMSAAELRSRDEMSMRRGFFKPQPELQTGLQEQVGDLEPDTY